MAQSNADKILKSLVEKKRTLEGWKKGKISYQKCRVQGNVLKS